MNVLFVEKEGTVGIIRNDLTIESENPVSTEVEMYVKGVKYINDDQPVSLEELSSDFLVELYCHTSVQKVKRVSKSEPVAPRILAQPPS